MKIYQSLLLLIDDLRKASRLLFFVFTHLAGQLSLCAEHRPNYWVPTTAIADAGVELDDRVVSLS